MPLSHLLLALAVAFVWGTNFVVIKWGLAELPPLLFATLRFALSAFPLLLFVRRPSLPWRTLAAFGVLLGAGQFGLLFYALRADISPGLASLVIQVQVFFTIGLAMTLDGERPRRIQGAALALAVAGMALIALHADTDDVTALGLLLVLAAALAWAAANMVAKSAGRVDMLGFMVWSSLFAAPALAVLSLAGRPGAHRFKPDWRQLERLGGRRLAVRGQHAVRLRRLELAAGAPSGCHGDPGRAAGAGVRHGRFLGLA